MCGIYERPDPSPHPTLHREEPHMFCKDRDGEAGYEPHKVDGEAALCPSLTTRTSNRSSCNPRRLPVGLLALGLLGALLSACGSGGGSSTLSAAKVGQWITAANAFDQSNGPCLLLTKSDLTTIRNATRPPHENQPPSLSASAEPPDQSGGGSLQCEGYPAAETPPTTAPAPTTTIPPTTTTLPAATESKAWVPSAARPG